MNELSASCGIKGYEAENLLKEYEFNKIERLVRLIKYVLYVSLKVSQYKFFISIGDGGLYWLFSFLRRKIMKRSFKSKLMVAVLVASTMATVPAMAQGNGLRGDINADGRLTANDIEYVKYMATIKTSDSADYDQWKDHLDKADFNNDGEVSSEDETMLRNYLGGDCEGDNCKPENQDCEGDKCKTEQPDKSDEQTYATDFEFQDADGKNISLSQYKGKKVLMMYFASWCGACKSELASYDDFKGMLDDEDVVFIALNYGEDASMVEGVLDANGYDGTLLFDNNYQISNQFSITGYPTNILIDHMGENLAQYVSDVIMIYCQKNNA